MKYLQSIGLKSLLLLVLVVISSVAFAQPTSAEKPANVPGQSANAIDQTPSTPANGPQTDFEPNNRMQDATPLSTRAAQAHKISWDLDRDWLAVAVPFSTLGVVRLAAQVPGQASVVLQARLWRQRADGSAEDIGLRRFDRQHIELALEPFNGRVGTQGRARKYWLQIEKAQGAANRVGFTANYKLLHRGSVLPSRNTEASALARSIDIYVDEPDNNRNEAKEIAESTSHARWLHWDLDGTGENYIWDQDVVTFVLPPYSQATLSMDTPGNSGAVFLELEEDDPAGLGGSSVNGWTAITGSSPRRFFAKATRNYGVPSVDHIAYTLSLSAFSTAGVDPDAYERAGEAIDNAHTDTSDAYTVQRNLHTTSDQDWIKGLKSASVPGSRGTISLTSNFPDLGLESQFYVELWIQHPGQARVRTYAGSLPLSMPVPFSTSNEGSNYWIHVRAATGSTLTPAQSPYKITYRLYTPPTNASDQYEDDDSEPGNSVSFDQNGNANPRYHTLWKDGASGNSTSPDVDWISYTIPANKRASILVNPVIGRYFQAGNMWSIFVKNENTGVVIVPERFFDEPLDLPVQSSLTEPRTFLIRVRAKPNSNLRELAGDYVLDFPYRTATLALSVNPASVAPGGSATMNAVPTVPAGVSGGTGSNYQYSIRGGALPSEQTISCSNNSALATCVFSAINPTGGLNLTPDTYYLKVRADVAWDNTSASVVSPEIPFEVTGTAVTPTGQFTTPCALSTGTCNVAASGTGATQNISLAWTTQNASTVSVTEQLLPSGSVTTLTGSSPLTRTLNVGASYRYRLLNGAVQLATMDVLVQAGAVPLTEIPDDPRGAAYNPTIHDYQSPQANSAILAGASAIETGVEGGAATFSVPIQVPPGRHGMQPSVSLSYSSRAGNGIAGMGVSVSGSMAISRCPSTLAVDGMVRGVQFDGDDKLCLDGQRLIAVSGAYGQADTKYRTELDSFVQVEQMSGGLQSDTSTYFIVQTKSGERLYFGKNIAGDSTERNTRVRPTGAPNGAVLSWLINTRLDRSNNNVRYGYEIGGSGENLLKEIVYTGVGNSPGNRSVNFEYEVRPDVSNSYLAGGLTQQTKRLQFVSTHANSVQAHKYKLAYLPSASSARSLLQSVQQCGYEAAVEKCFIPTTLAWQDTPSAGPNLEESAIVWPARMQKPELGAQDSAYFSRVVDRVRAIGDVDGDGVVELQRTISNTTPFLKSYVVSFNANRSPRGFFELDLAQADQISDLNNDGRVDLWSVSSAATQGTLTVRRWNSSQANPDWVESNFIPSSQIFCSMATASNTVAYFETRAVDVNADGWADLVVRARSACNSGVAYALYIHLNMANAATVTAPSFNPTPIVVPLNPGPFDRSETVDQFIDLDGDGVPELLTAQENGLVDNFPNVPLYINRVRRFDRATNRYTAAQDFSTLLPAGDVDTYPGNARRSSYSDINGDGLADLILVPYSRRVPAAQTPVCSAKWSYRMNFGNGKFGALTAFLGANTAALEEENTGQLGGDRFCRSVARDWDAQQTRLTTFEDVDANGVPEILVPRGFKSGTRTCTTASIAPKWNRALMCPPNPRTSNSGTVPGALVVELADYRFYGSELTTPYSPTVTPPLPLPAAIADLPEIADNASYTMSRLVIRAGTNGQYQLIEHPLTNDLTRQIQTDTNQPMDLYGEGLTDLYSSSGCKFKWNYPENISACRTLSDAAVPVAIGDAWFLNNGAELSTSGAAKTPELLKAVIDAYGLSVSWRYEALSSTANRGDAEVPLYRVPKRSLNGIDQSYIDANHFYFTSSMNVVAQMQRRNGIGSMNTVRYGYEEAMYNNKGRGFTGFRKIVTEDVAQGIRSATIFNQKFPLVSQVECAVTQLIVELPPLLPNSLSELRCDTTKALSLQKTTVYQCNGAPCNVNNPPQGQVIRVHATASESATRDLTNRTQVVTQNTQNMVYDSFGNATQQSTTTTDNLSGAELRTQTQVVDSTFDNLEADWWLGKLKTSKTRVSQSYGAAHSNGPTVPTRQTTSVFGYDETHRQVNCQATVDSWDGVSTCASTAAFEQRSESGFDSFGNVSSVTTTARDVPGVRSVSMNFAESDGYFPNQVTDAFGKSVSTTFDARFGVPTSVTDANGLITRSDLDVIGRAIRVTPPSAAGLSAGFPSITSYERCGADVACSDNRAVMRVVQSQYGGSQGAVYLDSLGRTIRSVSSLLGNGVAITPSEFTDSGRSVTDVVYNAKGQVFRQYEPDRDLPNILAYTEFDYDLLGRVKSKWQRFNRADQDALNSNDNFKRTRYTHMGTRTEIEVCQVSSYEAACGSPNADGSPVLRMSRLFDSSGKVLSTTDAAQFGQTTAKTTRFWYDGAGSPLRITDVMGLSINATYNNFGHRLAVSDPSRGNWQFTYNGFGELRTQTDARGQSSTLNYDELGRAETRTWNEASRSGSGSTNYVESTLYNNAGTNYGTVQKVSRTGTTPRGGIDELWESTPSYDALQRPTSSSTLMQVGQTAAQTLVQRTGFDSRFGRVKQITYPQSAIDSQTVSIYQFYSSLGMLIREGFAADYIPSVAGSLNSNFSPAIRVVSQVNGWGLISSERFGVQGVQQDWFSNSIHDSSGWLLAQCVNQSGACSMFKPTQPNNQPLDQRYRFDVYGNLKTQWHNGSWQNPVSGSISSGALGEERYTYDALHRLTSLNRTGQGTAAAVSYGFDAIGKLTSKSDFASSYQYPTNSHRLSSVTLTNGQSQSLAHDANGNVTSRSGNGSAMALIYDIDNLPRTISQDNRVANFYSAPGGRYLQKLNGRDTWYLGKAYEREVNAGQVSTERYYLTTGSLLVIQSGGRKLNYLHTDRLGSPVSISEKPLPGDGKLGTAPAAQVEHKGFDPFGKTLDGNWGISNLGMLNLPSSGLGVNQNKRNQRGFTGHEHLDEFALIHMNGRAYDYNLGQFYGVDPIVQFPNNSQSLNPYGYLMNNPLSGTDPTGYMGCAVSRLESTCDSTPFQFGGRDNGDSNSAITFSVDATTNNGSEKTPQTITALLSPAQINAIQDRGVTNANVTTDKSGKITGFDFKLGPSKQEISQGYGISDGLGDAMSIQSNNAARFVVDPNGNIGGDSGTFVGLMRPGERVPNSQGIDAVYPIEEAALIGAKPLMGAASAIVSGIRGVFARSVSETLTTRVGRWMGSVEYEAMKKSGIVQADAAGMHRVAVPASPEAYKAAPKGDFYVEYDVPTAVLSPGGTASWRTIYGPGSPLARLAERKGLPTPELPAFQNLSQPLFTK